MPNAKPNESKPNEPMPNEPAPNEPAPNDSAADLRRALLTLMGEADALSPKPMTARALAEALGTPEAESAIERCCRALHKDGLVDAFHEPYIASRYFITRAGREGVGSIESNL